MGQRQQINFKGLAQKIKEINTPTDTQKQIIECILELTDLIDDNAHTSVIALKQLEIKRLQRQVQP